MGPDTGEMWRILPIGYALTVALETPVLLVGLSSRHSLLRRMIAGLWLTACTYPIVILVLPELIWRPLGDGGYWPYVAVAEVFAPLAECGLFYIAFWGDVSASTDRNSNQLDLARDMGAIAAANLVSFIIGGWLLLWSSEL